MFIHDQMFGHAGRFFFTILIQKRNEKTKINLPFLFSKTFMAPPSVSEGNTSMAIGVVMTFGSHDDVLALHNMTKM